jgi:hypothetical protein
MASAFAERAYRGGADTRSPSPQRGEGWGEGGFEHHRAPVSPHLCLRTQSMCFRTPSWARSCSRVG